MNIKWTIFLTIVIGVILLYKQSIDYDLGLRNNLIEHVKIIKSAVNPERILNLKGDVTDYANPDYIRVKEQLTEIGDVIENVRYVYVMAKKDNKTVFLVDTQPKKYGDEGLAIPGEIYEEVDPNIESLLDKEGETTSGPYGDKWGTFISGLASITDKNSNEVIAIVGVDVETKTWQSGMLRSLLSRIVTLILLIIIEIIVYKSQVKNNKNAVKVSYLASVLESSVDAIYSIDFDKKILSWNLGAEKLYGYTADEVLGKNMTSLLLPDDQVNILDDNLSKISLGRKLGTQETIRKTKSGKLITVSIILSPVYDETGKINSISVIARDITKQKQIDENLERHNAELEKMNKLMLDRELIMMELKKKIKQYENK